MTIQADVHRVDILTPDDEEDEDYGDVVEKDEGKDGEDLEHVHNLVKRQIIKVTAVAVHNYDMMSVIQFPDTSPGASCIQFSCTLSPLWITI